MVQEIITYAILVFAVGLALLKSYRKLKRKKLLNSTNGQIKSLAIKSGCSDCIAECILRDAPKLMNENAQLCERSIKKIKCS